MCVTLLVYYFINYKHTLTPAKYQSVLFMSDTAGAAIGQVVASQFGLTEASPDKVLEAITADPEARLKLTELEFRHSEVLIL